MKTTRRIKASRRNGRRSRGPKTTQGKLRASQNAISHGLLSDCIVLAGESREGFETLLAQHLGRFNPLSGVEVGLIEEMAAAYWRMRRAWAIEKSLLGEGLASQPQGKEHARIMGSFRQLAASPELSLLHRYEARLHRMYQRALQNIILLRTIDLPNEPSPISVHQIDVHQ